MGEADKIKQVIRSGNFHFDEIAQKVFQLQYASCQVYKEYVDSLGRSPNHISSLLDIPYLPISAFKHHRITTGRWEPEAIFTSSTTTGNTPSQHYLKDKSFYLDSCLSSFLTHFPELKGSALMALLPSYLERSGSSLVAMADHLIKYSEEPLSGFFLDDFKALLSHIEKANSRNTPVILLGVSFALLDLAEVYKIEGVEITVIETGGMKGRHKEISRDELHTRLKAAFSADVIHSEYGMTELTSQAYLGAEKLFYPAHTMKVCARELTDPLTILPPRKVGGLNIIDLTNLDSCAFIATDDLGMVTEGGRFTVDGRIDHSEIRGCNLMVRDYD